tara:strand:- start:2963 stop:4891 length:1929 start_codon:yes stop_codon:yes gene_type:complete
MDWWEELLIRENSTPGAIARAKPKPNEEPGRKMFDNQLISLAEVLSNTEKEIQEDRRISNTNIRQKIESGQLDKENIPRIAQALKDKLQNLSKVIMINELREGIEKLAKDPRTISELAPILDEGYRTLKTGNERREFIDMIQPYLTLGVDREELMDSIFALMKKGGMDYSTYINDIITIAPKINRKDIMEHGKSKQEEELPPTKLQREYETVPYNNFVEVIKSNHTDLEKFKKLVQNVYTAWGLRDTPFKFYIEERVSGGEYGTPNVDRPIPEETTVASPLYILYKIIKHMPTSNIFSTSNYGALLGRREHVTKKRVNMMGFFAQDRVKRKGGDIQETIENVKLPRTASGSLRNEFDKWMAKDTKFSSGDYAKESTAGDLGLMIKELFPASIDLRAIYVMAFPKQAGVNLADTVKQNIEEFPTITETSTPIDLFSAYVHVIDSFNESAVGPLLEKLNEITRELILLRYYDEIEEEEEEVLIEQDDGSYEIDSFALEQVDQSKVISAVDDFNKELRKAILQTGETITRTLYDMIKDNLNRPGIGKYSLTRSAKTTERKPHEKQTEEDIARIKERESKRTVIGYGEGGELTTEIGRAPRERIRDIKGHKEKDKGTIQEYLQRYAYAGKDFDETQKLIDYKFGSD